MLAELGQLKGALLSATEGEEQEEDRVKQEVIQGVDQAQSKIHALDDLARRLRVAKEEEKKPDAGQLNLKVVTQDGSEIFFECKQTTPLQKLMNAFCQRQGVNSASVRFLFDGQRLNPQQTPQELEMEDGDVIDVMVEQQGGGAAAIATSA